MVRVVSRDAYVDIVSFSRYNDASPAASTIHPVNGTGCNNLRAIVGENLGLGRVRVRGR